MKILAGLSPMAGFTDMPFRVICTELGVDYTVSEMISAAAICFHDKKTFELAEISPLEAPCAIQIFGHDPAQMAYAADYILSNMTSSRKPAAIDINMGCPVRKIVTSGDGSALMRTPDTAQKVTKAVEAVTSKYNVPLWVKIRSGWDKDSVNAPEFAQMLADCGVSRITVHGRTREQMYAPSSDNGIIAKVRKAVPREITVIGNGDVNSYEDACRMIKETECDGVAVGRASLGNPWIFKELSLGEKIEVTTEDRINMALRLTSDIVKRKGELQGVREARGRAAYLIRGIRNSSRVRDELNHAESFEAFKNILLEFSANCEK